jgi:hypothetical protein
MNQKLEEKFGLNKKGVKQRNSARRLLNLETKISLDVPVTPPLLNRTQ